MIPTADEVQRARSGIEFINSFIDDGGHHVIPHEQWSWLCWQKKECYKVIMAAKDLKDPQEV